MLPLSVAPTCPLFRSCLRGTLIQVWFPLTG